MARGYPDYQNPVNQVAGRLVDFSGLQTAQLGLSSLDGLGRLVWFDQFADGLKGYSDVHSTAAETPVISTLYSEVGASCLKLVLPNAAYVPISAVRRVFSYAVPSKMGLDFSVRQIAGDCSIAWGVTRYVGGAARYLDMRLVMNTGTVQIYVGAGYTTLFTLGAPYTDPCWLQIKAVADFDNDCGLRIIIGDTSLSLVDYPLRHAAAAYVDNSSATVGGTGSAGAETSLYIGHLYVTMDEP